MTTAWYEFLVADGAQAQAGSISHFGNPAAERQAAACGNVLIDLSHLALIRARGADAGTFLQGQLSNDIRQLDEHHSQVSSYSTAKGRMLAILRLFRQGDDFLLQLPASLRDDIARRLRIYMLRSKVTLEPADDLALLGLSGPEAKTLLHEATGLTVEDGDRCLTRDSITALAFPGPNPRYEIAAPTATAQEVWLKLKERTTRCGPAVWAWLDIVSGLPMVLPPTSEAFVPQMTNLDVIGGVSFKKGCYPGQEIVARMQYLGRLKQRMFLAHSAVATQAGESIFSPDFGDQAAGTVVDAQPAPAGGYDLLVVAQLSSARNGELHLGSATGPLLTLKILPYALPSDT